MPSLMEEEAQQEDDVTFLQNDEGGLVPNTDGKVYPGVTCRKCGSRGHYGDSFGVNKCPQAASDGNQVQLFQSADSGPSPDALEQHLRQFSFFQCGHDFSFSQQSLPTRIPNTWILLDSCSTVSVFNNPVFLHNIRTSTVPLTIKTNGGSHSSSMLGDLAGFGTVWYNPSSLANILSLKEVRKVRQVVMDSNVEAAMTVYKQDGTTMKFREFENGLYFHNASVGLDVTPSNNKLTNYSHPPPQYGFINTMADAKERFTKREIDAANAARALYRKMGRPSQLQFEHWLDSNFITNCPLTSSNAKRAHLIYGPDIAMIKGKTILPIPMCLLKGLIYYQ